MQSMKLLASAALAWGLLIGTVSGQDNCNAPGTLSVNVPQTFDLSAATSEGVPSCVGIIGSENDIWYAFTPAVTGCYQIGLGNLSSGGVAQNETSVTLYTYIQPAGGACPSAGDQIACANGGLQLNATAGVTYLIRLAMASMFGAAVDDGLVCVQGAESAALGAIDVAFSGADVVEGGVFTVTITPNLTQALSALEFGLSYDDTKVMVTDITTPGGPLFPILANWTGESPLINNIAPGLNMLGDPAILYGFTVFTPGGAHALPNEVSPVTIEFTLLAAAVDGDMLAFTLAGGNSAADLTAVAACATPLTSADVVPTAGLLLPVVAASPCAAPMNLTATLDPNPITNLIDGVTLMWDADANHNSYSIERDGVVIGTASAGATSFVDINPNPGINNYNVIATCALGMANAMVSSGPVVIYTAGLDAAPATGLPIFLEFVGGDVIAGSFGLRDLSGDLMPIGRTLSPALASLNGGTGPEFENFLTSADSATYQFITATDGLAPDILTPGGPTELIRVQFDVVPGAAGGSKNVEFDQILIPPVPIAPPVAVTFVPTGGFPTQTPAMAVDGTVLVAGFFIRGDVNGDDFVQLVDAIRLLEFLFIAGAPASTCDDALDVNDDEAITILDGILLLQYLFGGGAPPEAPFPNCGLDQPAGTILDCAVNTGSCI